MAALLATTGIMSITVAVTPSTTTSAASWTVTTLDDIVDATDGVLSLREAMASSTHGDTITFDPALFADGARVLRLTAELIPKSHTIQGPGSGLLRLEGNRTDVSLTSFSAEGGVVTFTGADTIPYAANSTIVISGAPSPVLGNVQVTSVSGTQFSVTAAGVPDTAPTPLVGVFAAGAPGGTFFRAFNVGMGPRPVVTGMTISNFVAERGAAFNIQYNGRVTLDDVVMSDNIAFGNFCGGAIKSDRGHVVVANSRFERNMSRCQGAIAFGDGNSTTMSISGTVFTDNVSTFGGAVGTWLMTTISGSEFSGSVDFAGNPRPGLSINGIAMPTTVSDTTFVEDSMTVGNNSTALLERVTIDAPTGVTGLTLDNTYASIVDSTIDSCTRTATTALADTSGTTFGTSQGCSDMTAPGAGIQNFSRDSGIVTMTTRSPHDLSTGETVRICGVTTIIESAFAWCSFTADVVSVPNDTTLTFAHAGPDLGTTTPTQEADRMGVAFRDSPLTIAPVHHDPVVDAGGPYTVADGASVALAATASDPDGGDVTVDWDFDGDGGFDDATGLTPIYDAAVFGTPGDNTITARVTDDEHAAATATATVTVTTSTVPTSPDTDPTTPDTDPTSPDTGPTTPDTGPTTPDTGPTTPDADPTTAHGFTTIDATRVLDTREQSGNGQSTSDGHGPTGTGTTITIPVTGALVPLDATAVVLNVTATRATTDGHLVVYACDTDRPETSNANYVAGVDSASLAIAPVSADGTICLYTSSSTDVAVDVYAYAAATVTSTVTSTATTDVTDTATAELGYTPGEPSRLVDTRTTNRVAGDDTIRVRLPRGAAHAITVTATRAAGPGHLVVYDCAAPRPATSTVNYLPGEDAANLAVVTGTELCVEASAGVDIIVDHHGTLSSSVVSQERLLDTRTTGALLASGTTVEVPIPESITDHTTAFLNVTTTDARTPGHLSVHRCDRPSPETSNVNTRVGHDVANLTVADIRGPVCVTTHSTTHLVVDLVASQT